ncbi:hypothetical protein V8C40DRAFT_229641 [Trichoderma camerunense]
MGDGHTHGLFFRVPANQKPSFTPCLQVHRHAASAHTFCPPYYASLCTSQALTQACVKMHAWWGRTQKLCTRVMRPASTLQYSILPTSPRHHLRTATRSYLQLHAANCADQMRIIGSRNMSLYHPLMVFLYVLSLGALAFTTVFPFQYVVSC